MILNSRSALRSVRKNKDKISGRQIESNNSVFESNPIVYNEFETGLRPSRRANAAIKVIGFLLAVILILTAIFIASEMSVTAGQSSNSINFKYLGNEFDSSVLYTSSNQSLIQPFAQKIFNSSSGVNIKVVKPVGITLYSTKLPNLWSINLSKNGRYYWIQVAVATGNKCAYFLENDSPSSIFGAGIGEWYTVTTDVSNGCSSSVTPTGPTFKGWNRF